MAPSTSKPTQGKNGGDGNTNFARAEEDRGPRKKKAGGGGKKGKVFMENKSDLLSLISSVTSSKYALAQARIDKRKATVETEDEAQTREGGSNARAGSGIGPSNAERKKTERARALSQAKAAVLEKEREKKRRKSAKSSIQHPSKSDDAARSGDSSKPVKKRVGFA